MDFEQKYQKDPGMNRVNCCTSGSVRWDRQYISKYQTNQGSEKSDPNGTFY